MNTTPPTEDRDWKERFDRIAPKIDWRGFPSRDAIISFISQEITAAEARGRDVVIEIVENAHQKAISMDNWQLERRKGFSEAQQVIRDGIISSGNPNK